MKGNKLFLLKENIIFFNVFKVLSPEIELNMASLQ